MQDRKARNQKKLSPYKEIHILFFSQYFRKNEIKDFKDEGPTLEDENKPKNGNIFEEIEYEIEKHETHKKKLSTYLKFLNSRDGGNIARTNLKRMKKMTKQRGEEWIDDDEMGVRGF